MLVFFLFYKIFYLLSIRSFLRFGQHVQIDSVFVIGSIQDQVSVRTIKALFIKSMTSTMRPMSVQRTNKLHGYWKYLSITLQPSLCFERYNHHHRLIMDPLFNRSHPASDRFSSIYSLLNLTVDLHSNVHTYQILLF